MKKWAEQIRWPKKGGENWRDCELWKSLSIDWSKYVRTSIVSFTSMWLIDWLMDWLILGDLIEIRARSETSSQNDRRCSVWRNRFSPNAKRNTEEAISPKVILFSKYFFFLLGHPQLQVFLQKAPRHYSVFFLNYYWHFLELYLIYYLFLWVIMASFCNFICFKQIKITI